MPARKISIENAKKDKLFYFVANALVYRDDGRFLLLKRSEREKVHPGKYCTMGGKLEWNNFDIKNPTRLNGDVLDFEDTVEKLLKKEIKEEAGVEVEDKLFYINSIGFVRPDETPVVLLKFLVKYKSGDIKIDKHDFSDYAWVNEEESKQLDRVMGIANEISIAVKLLENKTKII